MALPWLKGVICIFHKDNKTLLIDYRDYSHKIHEGKWSPGGGKLDAELGDTNSYDAAIREASEEMNIVARKLVYRGKVHFNNETRTVKGKPMKINMVVDIYDCYDFDDSSAKAMEEIDGKRPSIVWIDDDKIMQLKEIHQGDKKMFEWLSKHQVFEGIIVQNGEEIVEKETKIVGYSPIQLVA